MALPKKLDQKEIRDVSGAIGAIGTQGKKKLDPKNCGISAGNGTPEKN